MRLKHRLYNFFGVRIKNSEVLTEALKHLWDGTGDSFQSNKDEYICISCVNAVGFEGAKEVKAIIDIRLNGYSTVLVWLSRQGYPAFDLTKEQAQDYRRRWAESMIAEFKLKGD